MTDTEFKYIKEKIERQFPIRLRLAALLGRKINPKKYSDLEAFDDTITELVQEIHLKKSESFAEAIKLAEKETEWRPTS